MDNINYVRERITELRIKKGVSEYQMSYDLGHSKSYINNISSGNALPSLKELFSICDYFFISPADFFNKGVKYPTLINKAIERLKLLDEDDLYMLLLLIDRLSKKLS